MRFAAAIILWLLPVIACAQPTVVVRAGEHGEFTRVTFTLEEPIRWRSEKNSVVFENDGVTFDTSKTFSRIGRDRLAGIQVGQGRATLDLGCPCEIRAFQASGRLVAVDIVPDGRPPQEGSEPQPTTPVTLSALSLLKVPAEETELTLQNWTSETDSKLDVDEAESSAQIDRKSDVGGVAEAIARAATLGLVSPISEPPTIGSPEHATQGGLAAALLQANARVGAFEAGRQIEPGSQASDCPADDVLPDLSIKTEQVIGSEIRDLVTHSGKVDRLQVIKAADIYLSRGFGVEAQSVLSLTTDASSQPYRWAIASYLDHGLSDNHPFTTSQLSCDSDTALWALTFLHKQADTDGLDLAGLVASFQRWPKEVRAIVGPDLNSILIQRDRHDLARTVLRVADFTENPIASALAHAELEAAQGRTGLALALLEEAPSPAEVQAPEYVIARINLRLETGADIPKRDLETAQSLLKEYRHLPVGQTLQDVLVSAYIYDGDLQTALEVYEQRPLKPAQIEMLLGQALRNLQPADFAWFLFAYWLGNEADYPEEMNRDAAAALKALGFEARPSSNMEGERDRLMHILGATEPLVHAAQVGEISVEWAQGLASEADRQISETEAAIAELEVRM